MKHVILLILLTFVLGCASALKRAGSNLAWGYKGWGIDPENIQNPTIPTGKEQLNWFYLIAPGKALPRAIEVDSPSFMEKTCALSAIKDNQSKLIQEAALSIFPKNKDNADFLKKAEDLLANSDKGSAMCRPTGEGEKYNTCDCVIFLKFEGGKAALTTALQ
jgi:hypothetical protein